MQTHTLGKRLRCGFFIFVLVSFLLPLPGKVSAQESELTVDEQYKQARQAAFDGNDYDKARKIAYDALERSPDYHGIRIFIARLYGWEGNYDKARKELLYVLNDKPDERRALLAMIDMEIRSGNSSKALKWSSKAQQYYPEDQEFMLKRASVLDADEEYSLAEENYRNILQIYPGSVEARQGLETVRLKQMKYKATLSYRHDRFEETFDPWNFWEFEMSRQTKFGPVIGRIQHADRFNNSGVQFNVGAYPSLFKGVYAYISGGYSEASIYPRYRFGLSLYKSLPAGLELEGGVRYLEFSSSETTIYTASLTKYWGSYLFTGRTYIVPSFVGSSQSGNLLVRRYVGDAETYFGISGGFGSASTDIQFAEDIRRLNSWTLSIESQYPVSTRINIGGNARYDSEEFQNFERSRYRFNIFLSYRF